METLGFIKRQVKIYTKQNHLYLCSEHVQLYMIVLGNLQLTSISSLLVSMNN
jgi:hypothetical protein